MIFTEEQIAEYVKCLEDPVYFIETYIKIRSPHHGLIPLKLHQHQVGYLGAIQEHRKLIASTSRQAGITTTTLAFLLWSTLFNYNRTTLVVEPKFALATEACSVMRLMLEMVPGWMKPSIRYGTKKSIELENGSKVLFESANENTGKGRSLNTLWLGDFSFVTPKIQQELMSSLLPTISRTSRTSRLIISSTRSGASEDLFSKLWDEAVKGESSLGLVPHNISYWDLPDSTRERLEMYISLVGKDRTSLEMNTPIEIEV
jgi:hypothetical protein